MNDHVHCYIKEFLCWLWGMCVFSMLALSNDDITENYISDVSSETIALFWPCLATTATYTLFKNALLVMYRPTHCSHHLFAIIYIPSVILCIRSYRDMLYRQLVDLDDQWIHKLVCHLSPGRFYVITAVYAPNPMHHRPIVTDAFMW